MIQRLVRQGYGVQQHFRMINPIFAHALTVLFLDHLSGQCRRPFLAERGSAEESVEVLIRQHDVSSSGPTVRHFPRIMFPPIFRFS